MAEWLSISEIVTHNIDGLPRSERGLRRWLNQRNIASRPRAGQGGGNEFNMALMPIKYRIKLSMLRRTQQPVLNNSGGDINNMGGFATCASAGLSVGHQPRDDAPHAPHRVNKNAGECLNTPPAVLNKNDGENHNAPHNIKNKTLLQTRLDLLDRIEQYATVNNMPYKIAVEEVLNARELVGIAPNPSLPTILRWKRWRACNDLQSLSGGNWGNRKDTGKINPDSEVEKILIGLISSNPHLTNRHLRDFLMGGFATYASAGLSVGHQPRDDAPHAPHRHTSQEILGNSGGDIKGGTSQGRGLCPHAREAKTLPPLNDIPSERTISRWRETWLENNKRGFLHATNPDAYQSKYRPAHGNMYEWVSRPNQLWEADASPADILTIEGRYHIYMIIDIYTRRVSVHVCKNPSTKEFLKAFRKTHHKWGKPDIIRIDNGKDFRSEWFQTAINACNIRQDVTDPYSGWKKAAVERHIRTIQHDLMITLPGYIGHNVERRKQIQSMKSFAQRHGLDEVARYAAEITADELANRCDAWAENRYFYRKHGGLENKSPAEQLALSGYSPQFIDTDMLRLFLAPPANGGHRVIAKKGVTVESANFVHPLMRSMIGTRIFIRLDEDDLGMVHCFAEDGLTFLFTAENSRRKGEGRELVATAFAEQMADRAEEKRKEIGKLKRKMAGKDIQRLIQNGQAPANLHVLHNMGGADNNIKGGATSLLGREDRAHALVKTPLDNPPAGAQHKQDAGCKAPHIIELPETAAHRWQKAKNLWKLIDEGFSLSPDETAWLKEYSATPEYTKRKQREDLITNKNNPPDSASNTIGRTE